MTTITENDPRMMHNSYNPDAGTWRVLRVVGWSGAVLILLAPLVAMLFTQEVNWTISDFLFAALMLGGAGLVFEAVLRHSADTSYRTGALVAIAAAFLLLWCNAAVGFIGSGVNSANVLYFAIPLVPIIGGFTSGFRAHGMFRTLLATAAVQTGVTAFAFATGTVQEESHAIIIAVNVILLLMWVASAVLFHQEAVRETAASSAISGSTSRTMRFEVQSVLSLLLFAIGAVMVTYMVIAESAPGALPLLMTIVGLVWFGVTLWRSRRG